MISRAVRIACAAAADTVAASAGGENRCFVWPCCCRRRLSSRLCRAVAVASVSPRIDTRRPRRSCFSLAPVTPCVSGERPCGCLLPVCVFYARNPLPVVSRAFSCVVVVRPYCILSDGANSQTI